MKHLPESKKTRNEVIQMRRIDKSTDQKGVNALLSCQAEGAVLLHVFRHFAVLSCP